MSLVNDIAIAKVCQVLALRDIEKGKEKDKYFPRKLYMARKGVDWLASNGSTDATLKGKQGYMVAMCGKYIAEAKGILAIGSTGTTVSAIYGNGTILMPYPINLTVTSGQAGVSTISNSSWVGISGINTVVINGVNYQSGVGFTFNSGTGVFDFSLTPYTLQTGDVITALGFKTIASGTITGGGLSGLPTTIYVSATAGLTINVPATIGHAVILVLRGGIGTGGVITTGSPTGTQVLFDTTTGNFTVATGNEFIASETITIQYY